MSDCSFKRYERVRKRSEYLAVYKKGIRYETQHFMIALLANRLSWRRLGITVSKKVGNACQRNGVKRRVREFFRQHKNLIPASSDIIITAKPSAAGLSYGQLCSELTCLFTQTCPARDTLHRRVPVNKDR